jgi:CRP-like cAMP-binding protein
MAWPVQLEANKTLIREGEESLSMYLVQEGELIVSKKDGDQDVVLGIIRAGELVGELSFLDQSPRSATVKAMTDCKLLQIPLKTLEEVMGSQPKWMDAFLKTLVIRIRQADQRIKI